MNSHMEIARMKLDKETDEEGKKRGVSMERSKAGTKEKEVQTAITTYSKHNKKHHIVVFSKIWKMYNEIQLPKNKRT